ncbi:uncharacterized protein K02A2.6-like [Toxorhynchites rutilus septentrionalis]|uniref:uncharacterized protein K02A2.6-like n=1 Tax=Toxorhynchites rutilus septentrionalis TaxID=329112 RepID=UPI00247B09DF|nr:uncharacterized protein K02A2.6-like [Toxorhynchites rutilus septentrionalis]
MERMKSLARSFVYWPNIDDVVEDYVRCCRSCAEAAKSPRKTNLESWPIPSKPWERVHIDYTGPINGYYYFLVIDAYSKWPEIYRTRSTSTTKTLEMVEEIFARYGNPKTLVSDNGSQFVSARFKQFCEEARITHLTIAPYHPQSNGQAERFVDTLKRGLKNAPDHKAPAELFLGRPITTTLDLLKPRKTPTPAVNSKQNNQFNRHHGTVKREFCTDDLVYAEVHHRNQVSWVPGKVIEKKGSVMYAVLLESGRLIRSHTNQLRQRHLESSSDDTETSLPWTMLLEEFGMQDLCTPCPNETADPDLEKAQQPPEVLPEMPPSGQQPHEVPPPTEPTLDQEEVPVSEAVVEVIEPQCSNQPVRNRRLPAWLAPYDLF